MSQATSELATVDKCLSKETPEDQLCGARNGLLNGLVHPKKSQKNKRNNSAEKQDDSVRKDQTEDQTNSNHCTNLIKGDNQDKCEKLTERETENYQSHSFVNNVDSEVDSFKTNEEFLDPVNIDKNHKLTKVNCDVNISKNDVTSEIFEESLSCNNKQNETPRNNGSNVSDILNDIGSLNLRDNFGENSCDQEINFVQYESELQMPMIMKIIQKDLSEPYSIYTYRYFIHNWPKLCFLAMCKDQCVGAIVCKLDVHRKVVRRGYIAMLAVDQNYRRLKIGSTLVQMAIHEMTLGDADEVVLETEVTNKPALKLYEKLGFVRDKRLFRYYLNGVDALRLKLWLR